MQLTRICESRVRFLQYVEEKKYYRQDVSIHETKLDTRGTFRFLLRPSCIPIAQIDVNSRNNMFSDHQTVYFYVLKGVGGQSKLITHVQKTQNQIFWK